MANEVKTIFTGDPKPLFQSIDLAERRLRSLNAQTNQLGHNPTFGGNLAAPSYRTLDTELNKSNSVIERYRQDNLRAERELSKQIESEEKQRTRFKIREAKLANDAAIREIRERERAEKQAQLSGGSGLGGAVLGGVGAAIGIGALALKSATSAAFDAERANRQLSASATQAGLSYQFLAQKSKEFADEGGISQTNANRTEGLIAKLAQATGKPKDLDKIETALLDTASARGLQVSQLETLVNAVISGSSDEPLNAVGLSDPGKLAKDYADKLGKSTEALTKQEQVLSRFLPLMQQAETVTGANADRMKSLSGQAETASAKLDDLQTNFGKGFTNSLEFRDGLKLVNDALFSMSTNITEVQDKLKQGFTPKQIAEDEANKTGRKIINAYKNAFTTIPATFAYLYDIPTKGFKEATNIFRESTSGAEKRFIQETTDLISGEQKVLEKQNKAAEKQKTFLNLQTFEDQEKSRVEENKKNLETRRKTFDSRFSNLGGLDDINQNRQLLSELQQNRDLFSPEEFAKKIYETQQKINSEIEKGKQKVVELGKQYNSVFDNLFQKTNSNNLFASVFADGDKAVTELRKNLAGLAPELRAVAERMQQKLNADSLFSARLENDFVRSDLRDDADSFRSFRQPKIADTGKFFTDFIEAGLKQLSSSNGGSFTRFNRLANGGFSQSDARNDLFYSYDRVSNADGGFSGFSRRNKTFNDLTNREKDDFINKDNLGFQDKLSRQIDLAQNRTALNDEQKRAVDRKLISLTQGVDPSKLTDSQRDAAASAREREATRLDQNEARAREQRQQQIELQTRIAVSNETLIGLAQKGGAAAVVKFVDETTGGVTPELQPAATAKDTQKAYDDAYKGGTFYEDSQK